MCLTVSWGWAMACQPDGLPLVRVLSLPAVVLWSAWWLMTTLWRARQADTGSPCMCVCMREGFYMLHRGSLFGGFQCEGDPPSARLALLLQQKKRRRRRRGVWGDRGDWERTEREVRHRASGDTLSNPHTVTGPLQETGYPYLTSQSGLRHSQITTFWQSAVIK